MRRNWPQIALAVGFAALLALIGTLQYRWLSRISQADGEKERVRVQEHAERLAADFNREIQNAYFNFQTPAAAWQTADWAEFNDRYDFWRQNTQYPELITSFYFFPAAADKPALKYNVETRSFAETELGSEAAEVRRRAADDNSFRPVYGDLDTLVLPVHEGDKKVERIVIRTPDVPLPRRMDLPPKFGFLAIRMNREAITGRILPDLTDKYFSGGEYRTAVKAKDGASVFNSLVGDKRDATAPLFDLSPENWLLFGNRELISTIDPEKRPRVVMDSKIETRSFTAETKEGEKGTVRIEMKRDAAPRTSIIAARQPLGEQREAPWSLEVQHVSGSLDNSIAAGLRRNLAIGFGLLFLLAAAILGIVVSAYRAKVFARRQVDFVSSVSHEFRTPLAVIYSAGENLADGVAAEEHQVARYGELIKGEGRKLSAMVEQILQFAGANSGRKRYSLGTVSAAEIVDQALKECRPLIDEKSFVVETVIPDGLPAIKGDSAALSQALQNLILNSVKYSDGSPWLRISAENGSGTIKFAVEDRGIGIARSDLSQVFEPFFRSKDVVDAQIHGNGLGLAIVKQIAEAHGGKVRVDSERGKGSTFTIEIPQAS